MHSKFLKNYVPEFFALKLFRLGPSIVSINLTGKCNQKCIYCEIGQEVESQLKGTLSVDDMRWILDEMNDNKIQRIAINGGEPLLFNELIDIVEYAGKKKIQCAITSNGMTIHKLNKAEVNVLMKHKASINISIDSFQQEIQSRTRGTETALSNAIKSIGLLHKNKIPVTILTAISKFNFHDLFNSFIKAHEIGVTKVLFQPIISYSNYADRKAVASKPQLNVGIDKLDILMGELGKIMDFEKSHRISTNVYRILPWIEHYIKTVGNPDGKWFFEEVLNKFYCRELYAIIDITYDGGIQACGLAKAKTSIHENRQSGLLAQWTKATTDIKDDIENERFHPYCNGCCHHFSRNMFASILKYPIANKNALLKILPFIFQRAISRTKKNYN